MFNSLVDGAVKSWQVNRHVMILAGGYIFAVEVASRIFGFPHFFDLYHKPLLVVAFMAVFVVPLARVAVELPDRPLHFMFDLLRNRWNLTERACVIIPPVILLALMMSSFSSIKSSIRLMNPHYLDPLFLEWDAAIHGGYDPWVLLQPILGIPFVTMVVEWFYIYWLGIIIGVLTYAIFMTRRIELRNQFIVAWILTWAVPGTLGAIAFNSVGPCFYTLFFPEAPDPYSQLMAYLHNAAPITTQSQDYLWRFHQKLGPGFGTGIAAMPSVHVAIATLQCFFLWQISRVAGIMSVVFAVIIMIGSVHLGWHYAIDGYASILVMPLIWMISGWLVRSKSTAPDRY